MIVRKSLKTFKLVGNIVRESVGITSQTSDFVTTCKGSPGTRNAHKAGDSSN